MSLSTILPKPRFEHQEIIQKTVVEQPKPTFVPPPYGHRQDFVPRTIIDYGDGGAFPEIHVLQYPLDMGRKNKAQGKVVPLQVDAEGQIKYDMVVRQGMRKDQVVFTQFEDLIERDLNDEELARPNEDDEKKLAEKTREALGKTVNEKIAAAQPTRIAKEDQTPVFIRYTPSQQGPGFNSGAKQRIIRLQEMPVDPLEPPKFKHKKLPPGPSSPPVPVMHSPPRKVTVQDQQNWKIPPCISNWKNIKGFTIPLDKRLAADGRGLQETQINDKFARLSESLFRAERQARKEVETRAMMTRKIFQKKKEAQENQLRDLAAQARKNVSAKKMDDERDVETEEDVEARDERESIRRERTRELRREQRLEAKKQEKGKSSIDKDKDRDISEKIALGQVTAKSKDMMFDQRLFNQAEGLSQGFGNDDSYDVFDKPLFKGSAGIYRPKAASDIDDSIETGEVSKLLETSKFKADREFKGAEKVQTQHTARQKPVEFEKDESDQFNLGELFSEARGGKRRDPLGAIGQRGQMAASAAGAGSRDSYIEEDMSSSSAAVSRKRRMEFQEASSNGDSSRSRSDRDRDRGRDKDRGRDGEERDRKRKR